MRVEMARVPNLTSCQGCVHLLAKFVGSSRRMSRGTMRSTLRLAGRTGVWHPLAAHDCTCLHQTPGQLVCGNGDNDVVRPTIPCSGRAVQESMPFECSNILPAGGNIRWCCLYDMVEGCNCKKLHADFTLQQPGVVAQWNAVTFRHIRNIAAEHAVVGGVAAELQAREHRQRAHFRYMWYMNPLLGG